MVNSFIKGEKINYGFIIEPATTGDLIIQMQDHIFYSSEQSDISKRPSLVLSDEVSIQSINKKIFSSLSIKLSSSNFIIRNKSEAFNVTLFNINGRRVYRNSTLKNTHSIKRSELSKGVYILQVKGKKYLERYSVTLD